MPLPLLIYCSLHLNMNGKVFYQEYESNILLSVILMKSFGLIYSHLTFSVHVFILILLAGEKVQKWYSMWTPRYCRHVEIWHF